MWVRTGLSDAYGSLRGHLSAKLRCLFKLHIPGSREAQCLAVVAMMKAEFGGQPEKYHYLVSVSERDWKVEQGL